MKTIHIIYTTLLLMLCSCGGISENKALKIAGNTPGFNESLYRLFTVGDHWCLSDSTYINQGTGHYVRRSETDDVHKPDFETVYFLSEWQDMDNNQIALDLNEIGMQFRNTPYRCDGCMECYRKFAEKGLITLEIIDRNPGNINQRVSVTPTPKGKTFLLNMQNKEKEHELLGSSGIGIKLAHKVYVSAKEMSKEKEKARYLFEYYVKYTPWSEALGYVTDKNKIQRERISFEKQEGKWKVVKKENITRNSKKRKF